MRVKQSLLGLPVSDRRGAPVGRVEQTWPLDGGGPAEFAIVRLGRFGERRVVPVDGAWVDADGMQVPYLWTDVFDAPRYEDDRFVRECVDAARSWWLLEAADLGWPGRSPAWPGRRSTT